MLDINNTAVLLIDVQGSLATKVHRSEHVIPHIQALIQCANILELPIIWLEQNPQGLGKTHPAIAQHFEGAALEKHHFNALSEEHIAQAIKNTGRKQWLVAGIEAHICVYQSVLGLLQQRMEVDVLTDCISSQSASNLTLAITKMQSEGAKLSSVEMAIFELMQRAGTPLFKKILPIIKQLAI